MNVFQIKLILYINIYLVKSIKMAHTAKKLNIYNNCLTHTIHTYTRTHTHTHIHTNTLTHETNEHTHLYT